MVVDTLDNLEKYVSLNPLFADVVKFIKDNDLSKLEEGKHFLKEGNLFVNITTAHGKSEEDAVLETHRKMIDIQIPLDNDETYGYTPLADLPEVEYNEAKDTLSTTDRNHRVYRLQTSLKRFLYWLTIDYTRCLTIQRHLERIGEVDVTQTINSLTQRVYDTSEEVVVYADRSNTVCTLHALSLLDASCRT